MTISIPASTLETDEVGLTPFHQEALTPSLTSGDIAMSPLNVRIGCLRFLLNPQSCALTSICDDTPARID
jgi:hypothetical protein